uniref:glycosyltransferase family 2 protein n=1 Tax=Acetatifactor sp. TaxID=1872090 RepID=UPI00405768CF
MKKVLVLLSTYNGEKYIKEQIESLLAQKGVDVHVLIRDDGSADLTVEIIESFKDNRITLYTGENLKPAKSFLQLVKDSGEADFYAFCDQDDVWNEDKLINAVRMMEKYEKNEPILYMSTYDVVDADLKLLFVRDMRFDIPFKLETTIMHRCPSGCTMVFNNELKKLLVKSSPDNLRMHDFWTLMVAEAFHATIVTDERSQLKYRQHENNCVGYGTSLKEKVQRWINSAIHGENERQMQAKCFYDEYKDILPEDSCVTLRKVVNYRNSIKNRIAFLKDKDFRTYSRFTNVQFVMSVLLGLF